MKRLKIPKTYKNAKSQELVTKTKQTCSFLHPIIGLEIPGRFTGKFPESSWTFKENFLDVSAIFYEKYMTSMKMISFEFSVVKLNL